MTRWCVLCTPWRPGVTVLRHEHNRGKGAALKTAFRFIADRNPGPAHRVVTLDADGQHGVADVEALARREHDGADVLVLGVREFSGDIPWRSRFGNRLCHTLPRFMWILVSAF